MRYFTMCTFIYLIVIYSMHQDSSDPRQSVFERLANDIVERNEKAYINRAAAASGISPSPRYTGRLSTHCQPLRCSKSKLGQTILLGNPTQQRHLETKLENIERQKLQSIRNMEWKQLDVFRMLAKDKLHGIKEKENKTESFQCSVKRQRRRFMTEQSRRDVVTHLPTLSIQGSLVCNNNEGNKSEEKSSSSKL